MLIAAANPCRCGYLPLPEKACARVPLCGQEYLGRISGPLLDRFDLRLDVPPVALADLETAPSGEASSEVAARVRQARMVQTNRYANIPDTCTNADANGDLIDKEFLISDAARALISQNAERLNISARSYHRILRVGRTIADLDGSDTLERHHIAEALSYRLIGHSDTA
jgi:magnesium chelatase family protein